jgi:hypothetical protein
MALKNLAAVSWGVYGTSLSSDQHANLFGSWGLNASLPGPYVNLATRVRRYLNVMGVWLGFSRVSGY